MAASVDAVSGAPFAAAKIFSVKVCSRGWSTTAWRSAQV
jgi:hypothetical protein